MNEPRHIHRLPRLCLTVAMLLTGVATPAHAAYTVNADGTVTDSATALVWDPCVLGSRTNAAMSCAANTNATYTWANALAEVNARNAANHLGHNDWRLPNVAELASLVDTQATTAPLINTTVFPSPPVTGDDWGGGAVWSSTMTALNPSFAWFVVVNNGDIGSETNTLALFVRLVRGGQLHAAFDAFPPTDGSCGSSNSATLVTAAPSSNLCATGAATAVTSGNSSYTWGCNGSNGGTSTAADACSAGHGYTVTSSTGGNGSISPSGAQVVAYNATLGFTVNAHSGYTASASGCGGNLSGSTYTTGAITADCTVTAQFTPIVNGACGSAANTATAYTPASANLCASNGGTASAVTAGSNAWAWSCSGSSNGGTNAACSAPFATLPGSGGVVGAIQAATTNNWQVNTATSGFIALPASAPVGVTMAGGATKVVLTGGTPGSQATVVLRFSSIPAGAQLYKYGKQAATDTSSQWFVFPATIDRNAGTVTYVLTDGLKGDNDWTPNGTIDDPVGLGVGADVSGVPTLSEWALVLLAGLMLGLTRMRSATR
jgi:hypothetical protein